MERVTGADLTPYALSYAHGRRGWRSMSVWVWLAGNERLKHLALIRASAASRRFAWVNLVLLAVGLGLFQAAHVGWRRVTNSPLLEPTGSTQPAGTGWLHVAAAPRPLQAELALETYVDLWWSPVQAAIAIATGVVVGLALMWAVLALIRAGAVRAHEPRFRGDQRMTAAIHYGTAWVLPVFVGTLVVGLRPLSLLGEMGRWPWYPSQRGLIVVASVIAGLGVTLWWFWLIRLGATAPASTRGRVVAFFALGAPLILGVSVAAWSWGLDRAQQYLFASLRLSF